MSRAKTPPEFLARARELRAAPGEAARALWQRLRNRQLLGARFRRQVPVGPYTAAFLCLAPRLAIELLEAGAEEEASALRREAFFRASGFRLLRIPADAVLRNPEGVLMTIAKAVEGGDAAPGHDHPHPGPPPSGEGTRAAPAARALAVARAEGAAAGGAASVTLPYESRYRRRGLLRTDDGTELLLDLAEATELRDGDALVLEDGRRILVRAAAERLTEVRGEDARHLLRLCWHLGNRHLPVEVQADRLLIAHDHVIEDMLARLGARLASVEEPFSPEGGAYGHGRTHGHGHAAHAHDDPNAHIPHRHGPDA